MKITDNRSSRKRLPMHVYLSYLLVAAMLCTGVTVSKYVASTSSGDSARAAAFGDLALYELDETHNRLPDGISHAFTVTPGVDLYKQPVVDFAVERATEAGAYVFVTVSAPGWRFCREKEIYRYVIAREDETELLSFQMADGWAWYPADDPERQIFYRVVDAGGQLDQAALLAPLSETDANTVAVSGMLYASELQTLQPAAAAVTFQGFAIQRTGFASASDAWRAIEKP